MVHVIGVCNYSSSGEIRDYELLEKLWRILCLQIIKILFRLCVEFFFSFLFLCLVHDNADGILFFFCLVL